ncbi:MAG: zinc-ribbon domain-containing protein [Eubacterium sp.]|nr:zinc-ribbon domain-containing protein [Eubacterium sp.]
MFCTKCGKQIDDGSQFCTYCGSRISAGQPENQQTIKPVYNAATQTVNKTPGKKKVNGIIIGVVCATVAVVLLIAVLIIASLKKSNDDEGEVAENTTEVTSGEVLTPPDTEATEEEETTEAVAEIPEVDEATITKAKEAYINHLAEHAGPINNYSWQFGYDGDTPKPVAYHDINRDGIPELIFMEAKNEYSAGYTIVGFKDGAEQVLGQVEDVDVEVAGGTSFYVAAIKDTDELFVYKEVVDEASEETYTELVTDASGNYNPTVTYSRTTGPNEDYTETVVKCYKDGTEISEEEFDEYLTAKQDSIGTFLLYSEGDKVDELVDEKKDVCMTFEEAKDEISDGLDMDVDSLFATGLPIDSSVAFSFASGAGGWGTGLNVDSDGSFTVDYHDSEMGDTGPGYPNGSVYVSNATGKFKNITKIDEYTYKMELDYYETEQEVDSEEIKDEIRYVYAEPYGIEGGNVFYLYLPGKPISELSEGFLSWSYGVIGDISGESTLSCYGIYNEAMDEGFYGDKQ